jgi:hypothetical protein
MGKFRGGVAQKVSKSEMFLSMDLGCRKKFLQKFNRFTKSLTLGVIDEMIRVVVL